MTDSCPQCHGPKHPNAVFQASHPEPESPWRVVVFAAFAVAVTFWLGAVLLLVSAVK